MRRMRASCLCSVLLYIVVCIMTPSGVGGPKSWWQQLGAFLSLQCRRVMLLSTPIPHICMGKETQHGPIVGGSLGSTLPPIHDATATGGVWVATATGEGWVAVNYLYDAKLDC